MIKKKIEKDYRYPPGTVLLVYHNASLFSFNKANIARDLLAAADLRGANIVGSIILYNDTLHGNQKLIGQ